MLPSVFISTFVEVSPILTPLSGRIRSLAFYKESCPIRRVRSIATVRELPIRDLDIDLTNIPPSPKHAKRG